MGPETLWLLIVFWISENQLNGFENGTTQLFNSEGVVNWAYFQKKVDYPLSADLQDVNFVRHWFYVISQNIFVLCRRKSVLRVWNDMWAVNDDRMIISGWTISLAHQNIRLLIMFLKWWNSGWFHKSSGTNMTSYPSPRSSDSEDVYHQKQALFLIKRTPRNLHWSLKSDCLSMTARQ